MWRGCFLLLVLLVPPLALAARAQVVFQPISRCPMGPVLLRDIASITGDSVLVSQLGEIRLTTLERPGQSRRLSSSIVRDFFVHAAFPKDSIEYKGMGPIEIEARAGKLVRDSIRALVEKAVLPELVGLPRDSWELVTDALPESVAVPEGSGWKAEVQLAANFDARGAEFLDLQIQDAEGKVLARQRLAIHVRRFTIAAFADREIQKGEKLKASDVRFDRVETTTSIRELYGDTASVVGRVALRTIPQGRMLGPMYLDRPWAVRRGDRVQVSARLAGGVVAVPAVAEADAYRGQVLALRNADSGKMLQARVGEDGSLWAIP